MENEIKQIIIDSIKFNLQQHPDFKPTKTLVNSVYTILKAYYIDKKRFVIAQLPTGSGKTIIGFMVHFCSQYIETKLYSMRNSGEYGVKMPDEIFSSYFLTSNKLLQDQIERDINRFKMHNSLSLLKGVNNYKCTLATQAFETSEAFRQSILKVEPKATFVSYAHRPCKHDTINELTERECYLTCPYITKRQETSESPCAVLNYQYFLNVMRSDFNPYFSPRKLTICDEAHLLPEIVNSMFITELTQMAFKKLNSIINEYTNMFMYDLSNIRTMLVEIDKFFSKKLTDFNCLSQLNNYVTNAKQLQKHINELIKSLGNDQYLKSMLESRLNDISETIDNTLSSIEYILEVMNQNPQDVYIESELGDNMKFKHVIRNLSEHRIVRENFINKTHNCLFMSATLGNMDNYAHFIGLEPDEYVQFSVDSTFDFSKSPIYLCNKGKLNYQNMQVALPNILNFAVSLCELHSNERGVIHTTTFSITEQLQQRINKEPEEIRNRFIFYKNSFDKEEALIKLKNTNNGILVGPSLYEGIDLKDDLCRFQIMIKVPYNQLNAYIKQKMKRYPEWYNYNCLQKIVQAIGRSNRHVNDYSTIYLLDSLFDKVIWDTNKEILSRIKLLNK